MRHDAQFVQRDHNTRLDHPMALGRTATKKELKHSGVGLVAVAVATGASLVEPNLRATRRLRMDVVDGRVAWLKLGMTIGTPFSASLMSGECVDVAHNSARHYPSVHILNQIAFLAGDDLECRRILTL